MAIKKGKKWALSFLAVSATALVGMNTVIIVKADELSEKKAIQAQAKISDNEIERINHQLKTKKIKNT